MFLMITTLEHVAVTYLAWPPHKKYTEQVTFGLHCSRTTWKLSRNAPPANYFILRNAHILLHYILLLSSTLL